MTDAAPPEGSALPPAPPASPQPSGTEWRPPRQSQSSLATIVVGVCFLVVGTWFFLERTLGIELPDIRWGSLWPILLIAVGAVILFRAARPRT